MWFLVLGGGQGALFHVQHVDSGRSVVFVGMSGWGMLGGLVQVAVPPLGHAAGCVQVEEEGMVVDSAWYCPREGDLSRSVGEGLRRGNQQTERIVD